MRSWIKTYSWPFQLLSIVVVTVIFVTFSNAIPFENQLKLLNECLLFTTLSESEWELLNLYLKFAMWLFLGYGAIQSFGRHTEYQNIEHAIFKADEKYKVGLDKAVDAEQKQRLTKEHYDAYKKQVKHLDQIKNDKKTDKWFYVVGIVLFVVTNLIDVHLIKL
jgi:hypothetical protein